MISTERLNLAVAEISTKILSTVTADDLLEVQGKHSLSDEEFADACNIALAAREEEAEKRAFDMKARTAALVENAANWGRKQAEVEILNKPLPWTKAYLVEMADAVVDHQLATFADLIIAGDEFTENLVCEMAHASRVALIERVVELSATAASEMRA